MLKRRDSPYVAGRPKGLWYKWKRDPHRRRRRADVRPARPRQAVELLLRLHLRRLARRRAAELVPVGKAYFGFTDEELTQLDNWVRNHTVDRFGPVREVEQAPRPRGRLRTPRSARPATSPASPCASPASTASAGTSPPPRPTGWSTLERLIG